MTELLLGLFLVILIAVFKSSIKAFLKNTFSKLSPVQVQSVFIVIIILVFFFPFLITNGGLNINVVDEEVAPVVVEEATLEEEIIADALDIGEEILRAEVRKKQQRDSVRRANREEVYVYKIGLPSIKKEKAFWELYSELKVLGNIYAFEISRNQYVLIKNDGYTINDINSFLPELQEKLKDKGLAVEALDLMKYCKLRESVVQGKSLSWKRYEEMPCLKCD